LQIPFSSGTRQVKRSGGRGGPIGLLVPITFGIAILLVRYSNAYCRIV
jgi:hypothetical protein